MSGTTDTASVDTVFTPRRLAHANLYVSDYEKAADFYKSVVGFNEAYRQPDNLASFVSNGNTYHDFGLTSVSSKYAKPGQKPGLFHIALEVETEIELVESYKRALAAGLKFRSTVDHDVAHSIYLYDPEDNIVEIYADVVADWKILRSGVVTKPKPKWVPGETTVPLAEALYPHDPRLAKIDGAVFHGKRVTHVALVTARFEELVRYYTGPIGLTSHAGGAADDYAVLAGRVSDHALTLLRQKPGLPLGLHHTGVEVWNEADLKQSLATARARGLDVVRVVDHPARLAVTLHDPDGLLLQFYVDRDWRADVIRTVAGEDAPYLL